MAAPDTTAAAALETLAALFDCREYITALITGHDRPPRLAITRRHSAMTDDIYARDGSYWRAGAGRIAPISDPSTAASAIASVLGAGPAGIARRRV
jgi:hypothetical protein